MVSLKPDLPRYREAGLDNPLGARALYLYQSGRDTLFRIHGTNEPWSIGEQVSSGCVRMLNEDVVDLYDRVPVGTTVLVRRNGRCGSSAARRVARATKRTPRRPGSRRETGTTAPRARRPRAAPASGTVAVQVAFSPGYGSSPARFAGDDLAEGSIDGAVGLHLR